MPKKGSKKGPKKGPKKGAGKKKASRRAATPVPKPQARDHIPATYYATRYQSRLTDPANGILTPEDLDLLAHVNCTYLSSTEGDHPPTLLGLKQHAQSLTVLIDKLSTTRHFLSVSRRGGGEEGEDGAVGRITLGRRGPEDEVGRSDFSAMAADAFDWLEDLNKPYDTEDELHHHHLWALANTVKSESESHGIQYHCPLHQVQIKTNRLLDDETSGAPARKFGYQTHAALLKHANECLELLDGEYNSVGGLRAILPQEKNSNEAEGEDDADAKEHRQYFEGAHNTLLGQWIMNHRDLTSCLQELQAASNEALDLVKNVAIVPMQLLSEAGTSLHANGRAVAYPQDKFVLAGVNEDTEKKIHDLLDLEEAEDTEDDAERRARGVVGDQMWQGTDEDGYARGLVRVELQSRFYRIKGARESPIFIMPTVDEQQSLAETQERESAKVEELKKEVKELKEENTRVKVMLETYKRELKLRNEEYRKLEGELERELERELEEELEGQQVEDEEAMED